MKKILAFTLAEVLITLSVIGVVAAMTIPTLVKEYQKTEYTVSIKKSYNEFNQMLQKISIDKECTNDLKCTALFETGTTNKTLGDEIIKYYKIFKNCDVNSGKECFSSKTSDNIDGSTGATEQFDTGDAYKFTTIDGKSFSITNYSLNCGTDKSKNKSFNMTQVCGEVVIDINGTKAPNFLGKDTYKFYITNGRGALLYPYGGEDDDINGWWYNGDHCSKNDKNGLLCPGRIVENGWDMDY